MKENNALRDLLMPCAKSGLSVAAGLLATCLFLVYPVTAFSQAEPAASIGPSWWTDRGVLKAGASRMDYAPANQGQLKNFAKAARDEMFAKGMILSTDPLYLKVQGWIDDETNVHTRDYGPVNLGQLKGVAKPFYDVLIGHSQREANSYPWPTPSTTHTEDYAMANIGQLKTVFNFEIIEPDLDGDGMADGWERQIIDASETDALEDPEDVEPLDDFDGDRVPNLWEYKRGTSPVDGASKPDFDAVVDQGASMLSAHNDLQGGDHYSIVLVKAGRHAGLPDGQWVTYYRSEIVGYVPVYDYVVVGSYDPNPEDGIEEMVDQYDFQEVGSMEVWGVVPDPQYEALEGKNVVWIGEPYDRSKGAEASVIAPAGGGMSVSSTMVFDGLIFDGQGMPLSGPALTILEANVALNNCIVRHCQNGVTAGALKNLGGNVTLNHTTICDSSGFDEQTGSYFESLSNGYNGTLRARNSIIWGSSLTVQPFDAIGGNLTGCEATNCVVQHGQLGALENDPHLNYGGYLTSNSAICIDAATEVAASRDINGELRGQVPDIGADEWINTDGDHLPDWWELWWTGSLVMVDGGDSDLDDILELDEFLAMTPPVDDQDGDSLRDGWERSFWGDIHSQAAADNPDGDERNNLAEQTEGTNPTEVDLDSDVDGDQLLDVWEIRYWSTITAQDGAGNPDGDERSNLAEQSARTNPTQVDPDSDVDQDQLLDVWEINYWQVVTAQDGNGNPDNDGRNNLAEQQAKTNPTVLDEDFDGDGDDLMDFWEISHWGSISEFDGDDDPDGDLLTNLQEQAYGTNPSSYNSMTGDVDLDGLLDSWEISTFGTLTESRNTDPDGDGVTIGAGLDAIRTLANFYGWNLNLDSDQDTLTLEQEWILRTSPDAADTDGDGVNDNVDPMPLDPLISTLPVDVPGPPIITLSTPPGATPVP